MKKIRGKRAFSLHHWCGLITGIFILVISVSGAILVFDDDLDAAIYRQYATLPTPAEKLSIDSSLEQVRAQHPGWEIRVPQLPTKNKALLYELRQGQLRKWLFVHPATGEVLHTEDQAHKRFTNVVLNLHYNLLSGTVGRIVVLVLGLSLLTLTVTGFLIYRKSIFKVLSFRQKISFKSRRSLYSSLHRVVGVWALVFNLLLCVTGITLSISVVSSALKGTNKVVSVPPVTASVDAALTQVHQQFPGFEVTYLRLPTSAEGKLQLLGRFASDPVYYGKFYSGVQVNYTTGELEQALFLRDKPWLERFITILHPLHFGDYAGLFVQVLYCIGGLMPGFLSVSGFVIWYYRSKAKKEKQAQKLGKAKPVLR